MADEAVNRQSSRNTVDQRQHVRREVLLQGGALVEVVQNNLGDRITLEDNHQTLTGASRGLITNIRNALDLTVANQLSNLVSEVVGVDLIGQFGDDQALASLDLFNANNGSLSDGAASRTVGILNSTVTQNRCAGWEIGAGNELDQCVKQFFARGLGVVQRPLHTAGNFTQVVRGDSRGHTDRNTFRTIHQDVGESGGKNGRFLVAAIVVVLEINAFFVDIADHFHGQGCHLTFGVTRCCRAEVTGGSEVTLARHQRGTQRPGLACERIVDCRVAVRVVVTHDVTDDAR